MKTLKERIKECEAKTAEIMAANPEINRIYYVLEDCDIEEIRTIDKEPVVCGNKLMGVKSSTNFNTTVYLYTPPFKSVTPIKYEF